MHQRKLQMKGSFIAILALLSDAEDTLDLLAKGLLRWGRWLRNGPIAADLEQIGQRF